VPFSRGIVSSNLNYIIAGNEQIQQALQPILLGLFRPIDFISVGPSFSSRVTA